ncbi:hypothetical protein [Moorena sp. SIO3A5]|uniref:hypothetical protein n=1 Tax=Moorena sp. SIO3A5 TaxID=2607822 RepID=UPI00141CE32F|nr:hypothetical protein [Moorena sp. SIO3A5]NEP69017.1 hypothetical protein [Moorena sp. SIO3A5]NES80767.1 hypothetical protein [Moorena sp. SIO2B7]
MGWKQKPQVIAKSKRANHYTGTLAKRSGDPIQSSGRAGEYPAKGRIFGKITPTSGGFRETVREVTQYKEHNALAPAPANRDDTAKISSQRHKQHRWNKQVSHHISRISSDLDRGLL